MKNNPLPIEGCMCPSEFETKYNCRIKKRINSCSSNPDFDLKRHTSHSLMIVYNEANQYGILTEDGKEFLAFEYDNIVSNGFGLLSLIKNGKLGLLHIKMNQDDSYSIMATVPCQFDKIELQHGLNIVTLQIDEKYYVYFLKTGNLLGEFVELGIYYDDDIISWRRPDTNYLTILNATNGDCLCTVPNSGDIMGIYSSTNTKIICYENFSNKTTSIFLLKNSSHTLTNHITIK